MQNHIHSANRYDTKINHARKSTETRWSKSWVTVQNQHKSAFSSGYILLFSASKAMGNAVCLDRFAPCGPREGHKFLAPMPKCRLGIAWWSHTLGRCGMAPTWLVTGMVIFCCLDYPWLPLITHIGLTLKCVVSYFLESCMPQYCMCRWAGQAQSTKSYSNQRKIKWDLWTEECKRSLLRVWPSRAKQALGRMAYAGTGVVDVWFRKFSRTCHLNMWELKLKTASSFYVVSWIVVRLFRCLCYNNVPDLPLICAKWPIPTASAETPSA